MTPCTREVLMLNVTCDERYRRQQFASVRYPWSGSTASGLEIAAIQHADQADPTSSVRSWRKPAACGTSCRAAGNHTRSSCHESRYRMVIVSRGIAPAGTSPATKFAICIDPPACVNFTERLIGDVTGMLRMSAFTGITAFTTPRPSNRHPSAIRSTANVGRLRGCGQRIRTGGREREGNDREDAGGAGD